MLGIRKKLLGEQAKLDNIHELSALPSSSTADAFLLHTERDG
jgi:hypothetical protein